jgi:hypothetical protein
LESSLSLSRLGICAASTTFSSRSLLSRIRADVRIGGNSGGGVFDAETHELLGIFTKIYTHGTLRPTVVPHMGLATPLPAVYDWLGQIGFAKLEPAAGGVKTQTAAAKR